jgi:hypothetical protein
MVKDNNKEKKTVSKEEKKSDTEKVEEIKDSDSETENLRKVVQPEAEIEIPFKDGTTKKVFWRRIGFEGRSYIKSYFLKRLNDLVNSGALGIEGIFKGKPIGQVNGENTYFDFGIKSIDEKTLKVYEGSTLKIKGIDYTYARDLGVLFFIKAPVNDITIEYEYYNEEIYREIFNDSFIVMLIYLCAMEPEDHNKKVFKNVHEIGKLGVDEVNKIISLYTSIKVPGDKLKN